MDGTWSSDTIDVMLMVTLRYAILGSPSLLSRGSGIGRDMTDQL
jgi:hypothetical protein